MSKTRFNRLKKKRLYVDLWLFVTSGLSLNKSNQYYNLEPRPRFYFACLFIVYLLLHGFDQTSAYQKHHNKYYTRQTLAIKSSSAQTSFSRSLFSRV